MSRILFVVVALVAMLAVAAVPVVAQDATPAGSPMASPAVGPCDAPALPPGTPSPMEEMGPPEGTPADDMAGMDMGTPEGVATPEAVAETAEAASPEAEATAAGTPADETAADEAIAAAENVFNCLNGGNAEGFAALLTANFMLSVTGSANPYDVVTGFGEILPIGVRSIGNAQTYDDGRISVDVAHTGFTAFGPAQVNQSRMFFVEENGYFLLDAAQSLPVEGATTTIDVTLRDYEFELSQSTASGDLIAFNLTNSGQYPHEFAVVQLPEGATPDQVLAGEVPEEEILFHGVNFAEPGGSSSFALEGLAAGTYFAVCFVDEPEGIPHLARGMVAEFTVE